MLMPSTGKYSRLDDDVEPASPSQPKPAANGGDGFDVRNVWLVLRWRAPLIWLITLATVALVIAALIVIPPKYKATTIVLVDPRQPHVTNTPAVLPGIGADAAAVESQVELIQSPGLASKVIESLRLDEDPDFTAASLIDPIADAISALLGRNPEALAKTKATRLIYKFQNGLLVRRRGLTYVIEINYSAKDPVKAARISGAIAEAYLDDQRRAKVDITAHATDWLDDRIAEMRERVRRSEQAVAAYRSANSIVDVTQGNKLINRQVEDLTQQLALVRSRTADARARLERVQQTAQRVGDPAALTETLQSQVIANLRSQYAEAARVEAEYAAIYGSRHPGLIAIRAQLSDVRRQIESEIGRILAGVRNEYQVAMGREASLESELAKLKQESATLSQADVKLHELEREAQANRALFEQFLNRAKETNEQQTMQIADARIVAPPLRPLKPDRPATLLLILIAVVGGLILGTGFVLMREQMRRGLRSATEVSQFLSLPCLGTLPEQSDGLTAGRWSSRLRRRPGRASLSAAGRHALDHPASPYAKNLRPIRARLRSGCRIGDILVVMSALPGEGKSTFACNLALSLAGSGARTLLIDGDPHTASLSRMLGLEKDGLSETLAEKVSFWNALSKEPKTGLHMLGARNLSTAPSEGDEIDTSRLRTFLRELRKHFDLIVIDSPAILPTGGVAPQLECADRALLVVEWDRTERQAILEARDMLGPDANKIIGAVLNKASLGWSRLFNYGGYVKYALDLKTAA